MGSKVLGTGVSGYVGQHCVLELLRQGYLVKGSVRNLSKTAAVKASIAKLAPIFLLKLVGLFNPEVKAMVRDVGKHVTADNSKTKAVFDWEPMPLEPSALAMAKSVEMALSAN